MINLNKYFQVFFSKIKLKLTFNRSTLIQLGNLMHLQNYVDRKQFFLTFSKNLNIAQPYKLLCNEIMPIYITIT